MNIINKISAFQKSAMCSLVALFFLLLGVRVSAQPINNYTKGVSIVNPNVASLGKYTDIPINLSTGVPSISVPIHTITEGNLSLPVSLNYHASGVKVNEVASWVGLGWSLSAGGSISRTILGLPDDDTGSRGFFYNSFRNRANSGLTSGLTSSELTSVNDNNLDTEADLFSFNFNGNSGKFFFDQQGKCQIIPKQDIKILLRTASYPNGIEIVDKFKQDLIDAFTIITPDGTKYYFDTFEDTQLSGGNFKISFHLTKIASYDNVNEIYIAYTSSTSVPRVNYDVRNPAMAQSFFAPNKSVTQQLGSVCTGVTSDRPARYSQIVDGYFTNVEHIEEVIPTAITTKSGNSRINFIQSGIGYGNLIPNIGPISRRITESREDVEYIDARRINSNEYAAPFLKYIEIKEGSFCNVKKLEYDYFKEPRALLQDRAWAKRLRLENVTTLTGYDCSKVITPANTPSNVIASYKFNYEGDVFDANGNLTTKAGMIHRLSRAIDHWGYFNGKLQNDNLADLDKLNIPPTTIGVFMDGNSNRDSDEESMKKGVLNKITYPTGGSTVFEYEGNKAKTLAVDNIVCINGDLSNTDNERLFSVDSPSGILGVLKLERDGIVNCAIKIFEVDRFSGVSTLVSTLPTVTYTWQSGETKKELPVSLSSLTLVANKLYKISIKTFCSTTFCIYKNQTSAEITVGGLRIKKTTFKPNLNTDNQVVTDYKYTLDDGVTSSGVLLTGIPTYGFLNTLNGFSSSNLPVGYFIPVAVMQSTPISPLGNFDGYHVAYKQVTVSQTNNGKSIYYYETEPENTDKSFPFVPYNFRKNNGRLNKEETYKTEASTDVIIGSSTYTPTVEVLNDPNFSFKVVSLSASLQSSLDNPNFVWPRPSCLFNGTITPSGCNASMCSPVAPSSLRTPSLLGIMYQKYKTKTSVYRLKTVVKIMDGVSTTTENTYYAQSNRPLFPIITTTTNSDGKIQKSTNKYVHEYSGTEVAFAGSSDLLVSPDVKAWMLSKNVIATPIETKVEYNNTVIAGARIAFGFVNTTTMQYSSSVSTATSSSAYPFKYYEYKPLSGAYESNWQLKGSINKYDLTVGLPKDFLSKGYSQSEFYEWAVNSVLTKRIFGGLEWKFTYHPNTRLIASTTDENGLRKKYSYDNLMRLTTVVDRFDGTIADPIDPQATTTYTYQYKNTANLYNFVATTSTFKGIVAPLSTKQYLDGLGRPIEVVKELYTPPTANHLAYWNQKTGISYDAFGRQNMTFQPFESGTLGYENPVSYTNPFVLTDFEASPLGRPKKKTNVDNTIVSTSYGTNAANDVRICIPTGSGSASAATYYPAMSLYKTTMTDENGKITCVFKDKLGRVVLTRKFLEGTTPVETYSVYDDYSQPVVILPPGSVNTSGDVNSNLTFQYIYDNRNRLSEKKVPGADAQKFYYDSRDLLILTQDGNMKAENAQKHLATIYDDLGRVITTGFVSVTPNAGTDNTAITESQITDFLTRTIYYPNSSWVQHQGAKVLKSVGVATNSQFLWSYIERRAGITYTGNPVWTGKQHLLSPNVSFEPITDYDYDGVDWSVSAYNGMQQPDFSIRYLFTGGTAAQQVRTRHNFVYDDGRRLTDVKYDYALSGAGLIDPSFVLSNMAYDYKDQLIEKNIAKGGSGKFLQSIDYSYNTRGWLTAINSFNFRNSNSAIPILTPQSTAKGAIMDLAIVPFIKSAVLSPPVIADDNPDLYSQNMYYNDQYIDGGFPVTPQYNGNISATIWKVNGRNPQSFTYAYDDLDRMTEAKYYDVNYSNSGTPSFSTDNKFGEALTYDLRGNIKTLKRNGLLLGGSWTSDGNYVAQNYGMIDNLDYSYDQPSSGQINQSNQILRITDASLVAKGFKFVNSRTASSDVDYRYDANGNLTYDRHKGISEIKYNYLNLPILIRIQNPTNQFVGGTIEFVYDAMGTKLRKILKDVNGSSPIVFDYVNGVEYKDNLLQRIGHTEGSVSKQDDGTYAHEYVLRDHLGNTRVTFSDLNNDGAVTSADIKQINNYYPFGLNMEGNWNGAVGKNKYQYNDKELNDDFFLNWNDYGARFYDAAAGRWWSIDSKSEKYYNLTPYSYVSNMPTIAVDPNGREIVVPNKEDREKVLKMINSTAMGTFDFDSKGRLFVVKKEGSEGYSEYYRDKLIKAIDSDLSISIRIMQKFKDDDGNTKDVDKDFGGGVTEGDAGENQTVTISGNESTDLKDKDDKPLKDKPSNILAHELVGHAIPAIVGTDTGNAVENENKVRAQLKEGNNKLRKAEPKHIE